MNSALPERCQPDVLFSQSPIGIVHIGLDGGILQANPAFCQLIGYTETQLRRLDWQQILSSDGFAAVQRAVLRLYQQGSGQQSLQTHYLCGDGAWVAVEMSLSLVGAWEDDNSYLLSFVTDRSQADYLRQENQQLQHQAIQLQTRLQQQTQVLAQTLRFDQLVRHLTETLCYDLDGDQVLQMATTGSVQALGVDGCYIGLITPAHYLEVQFACLEGMGQPAPAHLPYRLRLEDLPAGCYQQLLLGQPWVVSHTVEPWLAPQGRRQLANGLAVVSSGAQLVGPILQGQRLVGVIVLVQQSAREFSPTEIQQLVQICDLCAIALRQSHLYHQEHQQRLSAEYFRSFLEKSIDVFVEYDSTFQYLSINPSGATLLGRPSSEILGRTNREILGSEVGVAMEVLIRQAFNTGEKVFVDHELLLPSGLRVFETIYAPITDPAGNCQRVIGVWRDVTEMRQQWQLLETQNHQLAETARLKEEFIATTSHELRTPLTAILGFSNVLLQEFFGELNLKQKDYVERIHSSGQHLLELINDILDLSRLEADRLELEPQLVFIPDVCEGALALVQERVAEQGLALEVEIDPALECMVVDPRRLKQMLLNLLTNAIKFTPTGKVGLRVYRSHDPGYPCLKELVHFQVWDTGIGITEVDQKRLFAPFSQIDSSLVRKHQGTGLGLVITRKLAELHGGNIRLESLPGQGTRFTLSLPLHQSAQTFWSVTGRMSSSVL